MTRFRWNDLFHNSFISFFLAGLVFIGIWAPELMHWYVKTPSVSHSLIAHARLAPGQTVLDEIASMRLGGMVVAPTETIAVAEQVMKGSLNLPDLPATPITLPFAPEDLDHGLPVVQLMTASLAAADILLDAYKLTRREAFFYQARDAITGFANYEASQWLDRGLMWNDHAMASRISVLIKFWAAYRARPDFDPQVANTVIHLVLRSAKRLAKPSFYAWRTGHGIAADLALLQLTAAFSNLPEIEPLRQIAASRFRQHLNYWVNEEGVTLLHSAQYHAPYTLGLALRLYTLNGLAIPPNWWQRYTNAIRFYRLLSRPDKTLPMYGDTHSMPIQTALLLTQRASDGTAQPLVEGAFEQTARAFAVYPVAGHAVFWDSFKKASATEPIESQTVFTWSYHPGLGHKIADELSLILWTGGRTWLTNTGYWPYGLKGRHEAESWGATNAPHLRGESANSVRSSRVRGQGEHNGIAFIDAERSGHGAYAVRRQIIRLADEQSWVVLDHSLDTRPQTRTTHWTFYPDLSVNALPTKGQFWVAAENSPAGMLVSISGSAGQTTELTAGRYAPFAGWVVMNRIPTPAPAIVVNQPSPDSWSLAALSLHETKPATASRQGARMARWVDAEHWTTVVSTATGDVTLTRTDNRLLVRQGNSNRDDVTLVISTQAAPAAEVKAIRDAVIEAADKYPAFRELMGYRLKVSYLLLATLAGQECLLFLMRRRAIKTAQTLRITSWMLWAGGGLWLLLVYF